MLDFLLSLRLLLTGLFTLLPVVWVHQLSLENFWLQSYHSPAPWLAANQLPLWQAGSRVQNATVRAADTFWKELSGQPVTTPIQTTDSSALPIAAEQTAFDLQATPIELLEPLILPLTEADQKASAEQAVQTELQILEVVAEPLPPMPKQQVRLAPGQRIFFAGDSMMQGVAPHLLSRLRKEHSIAGLDLSKQSTGLAYPSAFNWPRAIEDTLSNNPDIAVLAVFMGPNDPWDMPSGKGGPFLRFRSDDWEALYRSRIQHVLHTAQQHKVEVIWVAPPLMRKTSLSEKMDYIAELYQQEVEAAGELFLSSNQILGYIDGQYSDYPSDGQPRNKLRAGDGIHFTLAGQRLLAEALYQRLQIELPPEPEPEPKFDPVPELEPTPAPSLTATAEAELQP